jgi:hypothetical protein
VERGEKKVGEIYVVRINDGMCNDNNKERNDEMKIKNIVENLDVKKN